MHLLDRSCVIVGIFFEIACYVPQHPCSSLCGLNITTMKLFDAYRRINSRILEVTLEYLGDIRVLVDLYLKVLF